MNKDIIVWWREGAAVTDGDVGVDGGGCVYDGIVADGDSGLDDGGGDTGPEGWVVLVDYGCGDMRAEGSMEGGSLGMDDVSGGEGDKACGV